MSETESAALNTVRESGRTAAAETLFRALTERDELKQAVEVRTAAPSETPAAFTEPPQAAEPRPNWPKSQKSKGKE